MQVGIEGGKTAARIRRYAKNLGLKLELQRSAGELVIVAREIQTSILIIDLPGMGEAGSWQSWPDCLAGLKRSKRRF